MKLETVDRIITALKKAEDYRRKPEKDEGSCVGGLGIFMKVGNQELWLVSPKYYQGSLSKEYEIIEMLPYLQNALSDYEVYYSEGWLD